MEKKFDTEGNEIVDPAVGVTDELDDNPQGDPPAIEPPEKSGVQKRMDELTKKRRDAERESDYWRGVAEGNRITPPVGGPEPEPEPKDLDPNDFDTDADYLKAVAKQTRDEIRAEAAREAKASKSAETQAVLTRQYGEARKKYEDFDDVALNPSITITGDMFEAAQGESLGDVLYHLGKNPAEASRIAALPSMQQVKEIGKIETKLTAITPVKQSNAPNPPPIISGGGSPPGKKDSEKTRAELHAEWDANRRAEAGL